MGKLTRAITEDGSAIAYAIDSTDIVSELEQIHKSSAVITAALGRLTTAAALFGRQLKGERDSVTLRVNGGGPAGTLIAVADCGGNVRGYVENPVVELPLNPIGKLDVGRAVGKNGTLSVARDMNLKEPYTGQVPLVSGEIGEDVTGYFAASEQIPTICGLGVLVNPNLTVRAAGGYLVQLLPFADESCISILEENAAKLPPVSQMIDAKLSPAEICGRLLQGLNPNVLDETDAAYICDCSRKRVERILRSIQRDELTAMRDEDHGCEVCCHFCGKKYRFTEDELTCILAGAGRNKA